MTTHRAQRPAPRIEMPITAMLDMSFQMLFFFIINYNPSTALEGQLDMLLPAKIEEASKEKENPMPVASDKPNEDVKLPADLTVVVKTQNDGVNNGIISGIVVKNRAGETVVPNLQALTEHLEKSRDGLSNKDDLNIVCDTQLRWNAVMQVVDACKKANFNVGFGQPPDRGMSP